MALGDVLAVASGDKELQVGLSRQAVGYLFAAVFAGMFAALFVHSLFFGRK